MVKRILILLLINYSAYSRLGPLQLLNPSSRNLLSNTLHSTRDESGQMDAVTGGGNSESEEAPSCPRPPVGDLVSFSGREPTVQGSERRKGGGLKLHELWKLPLALLA